VRDQGWERGGAKGEEKMAYFERKRKTILALSGLTTNKKAKRFSVKNHYRVQIGQIP
jgi:predicted DNA-binding WGR domain protein